MNLENLLLVFIQIGVVFAGFSGVVSAFRHRDKFVWYPPEKTGIKFLIEHSFAASALSAFTVAFARFGASEPRVWAASSALAGAFLLLEVVVTLCRLMRLTRGRTPPRHPQALKFLYLPGSTIIVILQGFNTAGWHSPIPYLVALFWLFISCGVQLYNFLFRPEDGGSRSVAT